MFYTLLFKYNTFRKSKYMTNHWPHSHVSSCWNKLIILYKILLPFKLETALLNYSSIKILRCFFAYIAHILHIFVLYVYFTQ